MLLLALSGTQCASIDVLASIVHELEALREAVDETLGERVCSLLELFKPRDHHVCCRGGTVPRCSSIKLFHDPKNRDRWLSFLH